MALSLGGGVTPVPDQTGAAGRMVDDVAPGVDAACGLVAGVDAVVVDAGAGAGTAEAVAVRGALTSKKRENIFRPVHQERLYLVVR